MLVREYAGLADSTIVENINFHHKKNFDSFTGSAAISRNGIFQKLFSLPVLVEYLMFPDSYELEAIILLATLQHLQDEANYVTIYVDNQALVKQINTRPTGPHLPVLYIHLSKHSLNSNENEN